MPTTAVTPAAVTPATVTPATPKTDRSAEERLNPPARARRLFDPAGVVIPRVSNPPLANFRDLSNQNPSSGTDDSLEKTPNSGTNRSSPPLNIQPRRTRTEPDRNNNLRRRILRF